MERTRARRKAGREESAHLLFADMKHFAMAQLMRQAPDTIIKSINVQSGKLFQQLGVGPAVHMIRAQNARHFDVFPLGSAENELWLARIDERSLFAAMIHQDVGIGVLKDCRTEKGEKKKKKRKKKSREERQ